MKRDKIDMVIEKTSSVGVLAEDYRRDLEMLRMLSPVLVTNPDIDMLEVIASKYGKDLHVTRDNYVRVLGRMSNIVREKLEALAITHELESVRVESVDRKPKQEKVRRSKAPEVFDND